MAFGECPECGKMTLIRRKRRDYLFGLIHEVKCVNPECDFCQEIEDEDIEDDDKEEEEEEF
jgi:ssDNA-binding Zn-finger/Zn-ribbon topoisomerase 1